VVWVLLVLLPPLMLTLLVVLPLEAGVLLTLTLVLVLLWVVADCSGSKALAVLAFAFWASVSKISTMANSENLTESAQS
jgi:hypothetical protein